jgi:hypothetical protein
MNEKEKNASIEYILTQGLVKPQTAYARIAEMFRCIGFQHIFWDTGYSVFFAAVSFAIVFALFVTSPTAYRYSAAAAVAPLSYLLIMAFAETSERSCGLYELKQTCRYTIQRIIALRVLCYTIAGSAFTAVIAVVGATSVYDFFSVFALCLSALFLCAALSLTVMRVFRGKWVNAIYSAIWVFVNIALPFSLGDRWEKILGNVPMAISILIAAIGAAVLAYQISKMLSEVKKYALA